MKQITITIPDNCEVQIVRKEEKKEPVIRTYQDLIDNSIKIKVGYWIELNSNIHKTCDFIFDSNKNRNVAASEKVAKSMLAMAMISQLMPYYGGEITDEEWEDTSINKFTIERDYTYIDCIHTDLNKTIYHFLAFHTAEQRDEFLKYNEQLVKDYLMID